MGRGRFDGVDGLAEGPSCEEDPDAQAQQSWSHAKATDITEAGCIAQAPVVRVDFEGFQAAWPTAFLSRQAVESSSSPCFVSMRCVAPFES